MSWAKRCLLIGTGVYWMAMLIATHMPARELPRMSAGDKVEHLVGFGGLAGLLLVCLWAIPNRWAKGRGWLPLIVVGICAAYGVFDERTQPFFKRTCDLRDWMADVIGASLAVGLLTAGRWVAGKARAGSRVEEPVGAAR